MPVCAPMKFEKCEENSVESEPIAKKSKIEEPAYFMCLWKKADTEAGYPFCTHEVKDFQTLIEHLIEVHDVTLTKNVDFCPSCQILFGSSLQGIHHYLSKALNYEDFEMKNHHPNIQPGMGAPILKKIKELSEDVMDKLIYQNMPELEEFVEGHDTVDMIPEPEGLRGDDVGDFSPDPAMWDANAKHWYWWWVQFYL